MTTTKILFSGKHLFVNANAEGGQLTVEVLDGSGVTLRGFAADRCIPIRADGTRQMVRWQSSRDLSRLIGKPVRIRFYLVRAQLYSFWVSPSVSGESLGYVAAGGPGLNGWVARQHYQCRFLCERNIGIPRTTSFWFAVLTIVGWEARRRIDATPSFR